MHDWGPDGMLPHFSGYAGPFDMNLYRNPDRYNKFNILNGYTQRRPVMSRRLLTALQQRLTSPATNGVFVERFVMRNRGFVYIYPHNNNNKMG